MANVTVGHLVDMALEVLQDDQTTPEHWTKPNLLNWYNLGTRETVNLAPEANAFFESMKLASGVKQSMPANRIALIDVIRNMGVDGNTAGAGITKTDVGILTAYDRSWITATPSATIKNWAPQSLTVFYVSPPSDGTTYVEIKAAAVPTIVSYDAGGVWESALVGVAERYVNAVLNWIVHRAYQKDSDYPGNDQRSRDFYNQFLLACGVTPGMLKGK
jgi:hypothetical protein